MKSSKTSILSSLSLIALIALNVLPSTRASAGSSRQSDVLTVDRLPMTIGSACYSYGAKVVRNGGSVILELHDMSDDQLFPVYIRKVLLVGPYANSVSSAQVNHVKSGWMPKCTLTLR